ncbi:MAG: 3-deoxy-D-manno-octulosonic acid transferase [Pseudomonadota bacterium]
MTSTPAHEAAQNSDHGEEPMSLRAYRAASRMAGPVARMALRQRLKKGKEDPDRIDERQGTAGATRPEGPLLWIHGASVGESLSVLPLVRRLSELSPALSFLVTTGTVTSARLMAERLPARAIHQFIPLDHPQFVERFLDHWQPDAAVFVESEFWPNLILGARARTDAMALVNGRVSPKSFDSWTKRRGTIRYLLDSFDVIIAQDHQNAERLQTLSGRDVPTYGNLKNSAPALPVDDTELAAMRSAIGTRPVWLAASSHPGEEEFIFDAHKILRNEFPDLLTLLAPRHPERGDTVREIGRGAGLTCMLRSEGGDLTDDTQVYIADTLGELGLFYRLSSVSFVGGSLVEKGGHNPLEPARLGCAILHGPYTFNFVETYGEMRQAGGAALVRNERELATAVRRLLGDEKTRAAMATTAKNAAEASAERVLTNVAKDLMARLSQAARAIQE